MQHKDLASGRWSTLTLAEQLGNAGSEFERALAAKKEGDKVRFANAAARFYELMDLTIADERWSGLRRREIIRVKEQSTAVFETGNRKEAERIQVYFFKFALLARTRDRELS